MIAPAQRPASPVWQAEFPDYPCPDMPVEVRGWHDLSWRNDACPNFRVGGLAVFVDYAQPDKREFPELQRFTVYRCDLEPDGWAHPARSQAVILTSDDWADVLAAVANCDPLGGQVAELAELMAERPAADLADLFRLTFGREPAQRWGASTPSAGGDLEDSLVCHDIAIIEEARRLTGADDEW
ncbi:MAG: hypothetical protein KKA05_10290 [Alphaproteobacteria bacterium]|nr:hypothetical protein [Alphaproteobacteria bacterium]